MKSAFTFVSVALATVVTMVNIQGAMGADVIFFTGPYYTGEEYPIADNWVKNSYGKCLTLPSEFNKKSHSMMAFECVIVYDEDNCYGDYLKFDKITECHLRKRGWKNRIASFKACSSDKYKEKYSEEYVPEPKY